MAAAKVAGFEVGEVVSFLYTDFAHAKRPIDTFAESIPIGASTGFGCKLMLDFGTRNLIYSIILLYYTIQFHFVKYSTFYDMI